MHWSPDSIENLEYYRYEIHLENLKEILEEKRKAESGDGTDHSNAHKMPKIPNYKPPKLPNYKMPK